MNYSGGYYNAGGEFIKTAQSDFVPLMLMGIGIAVGMFVSNELFKKIA